MWQKILFLSFLLIISCMFNKTYAQTVEVSAMEAISTLEPPASTTIKLLEPLEISTLKLETGFILKGKVYDVVSPKRLKQDATFSFKPETYTDLNGKTKKIKTNIEATYTTPINKGELAKNAALGVGSYFVKGLSVGVAAISGAVQNEEGNRIKSSITSAYDSTPFSLVEKGEELDIKTDDHYYLNFKIKETTPNNEIQGQNYSFTIEKE